MLNQLRPELPFVYASFLFNYLNEVKEYGIGPRSAYLLLADMPVVAAHYVRVHFYTCKEGGGGDLPLEQFLLHLEEMWQPAMEEAYAEEVTLNAIDAEAKDVI